MVETKELKQKTDWLVPTAVVLGGVGIAAGLYFYMKKPSGVDPGDKVRARFTFDYLGSGGNYILLVRFGYHRISGLFEWFDPEEGLDNYIKPVTLASPDPYEFDVDCVLPDGTPARTYDAEASILTPYMQPGQDWLIRVFKDKAITVREED